MISENRRRKSADRVVARRKSASETAGWQSPGAERSAFALRKAAFRGAEGSFSECRRRLPARQKGLFGMPKGLNGHCFRCLFVAHFAAKRCNTHSIRQLRLHTNACDICAFTAVDCRLSPSREVAANRFARRNGLFAYTSLAHVTFAVMRRTTAHPAPEVQRAHGYWFH